MIYDLHQRDLVSAQEDLLALIGAAQLHAEGYTLVIQMIRSAIVTLEVEATWNALQAHGWTDQQLATLQSDLERLSFFKNLEQTFRVERAVGLRWIEFARTNATAQTSVRARLSEIPERVFGSIWQRMWMDQDLLLLSQCYQTNIDGARKLAADGAFSEVARALAAARENLDRKTRGPLKFRYPVSGIVIPNNSKAIDNQVKNETLRQLAIAAIALKRFELRHTKLPRELSELHPEFLPSLPTDYFDGKPVRYRLKGDGSFLLYSVGPDFRDDGGQPGTDLIWPRPLWPETNKD